MKKLFFLSIILFLSSCSPQKKATRLFYNATKADKETVCRLGKGICLPDSVIKIVSITETIRDTLIKVANRDSIRYDTAYIYDTTEIVTASGTITSYVEREKIITKWLPNDSLEIEVAIKDRKIEYYQKEVKTITVESQKHKRIANILLTILLCVIIAWLVRERF